VYLNKVVPIDTSGGPLSVARTGWEEGEAKSSENEVDTGPGLISSKQIIAPLTNGRAPACQVGKKKMIFRPKPRLKILQARLNSK
jgi:hypothetical protein